MSRPDEIATSCTALHVDANGRLESFDLNGNGLDGRLLVGTGRQTVALGATVALSSAYQIVSRGGESLEGDGRSWSCSERPHPLDGPRDLATSVAEYRTATGAIVSVDRVVAQGSPLQPGASAAYALQFPPRRLGGAVTVPVLTGPALTAGPDDAVEPAVVPVRSPR